jgi:4-amino-4-deoxy-L-arabinose transferase-like glycosyltransferase
MTNVRPLVLIAACVVLVRLAVFLVYPDEGPHLERSTPDGWLTIARSIVNGEGYTFPHTPDSPTARRGPTVVYFFAAVLWLAGDHLWSIVIAQWLADVGTAILLFFIAREIFQDRRVALLSSLLFTLYGSGIVYTFRAWSEPVFTFVLAGFIWSLLCALREPSFWRFALSGGLLGVAVLARPVMQFYPLLILPLVWWAVARPWRQVVARFAVFCAVFATVLLPWVIRNYVAFQAFIPASSHSGNPFYQSHFVLHKEDYLRYRTVEDSDPALLQVLKMRFGSVPREVNLYEYARVKGLSEHQVDRIAFHEAVSAIRAYPERYIVASLVRLTRLWFGSRFVNLIQGRGSLWSYPVPLANGLLLILAVIGMVCFRGAWLRSAVPLIVLIVYNSVVYAASLALARYNVPVMPYVMLFAAYAVIQVLTKSGKITTVPTYA